MGWIHVARIGLWREALRELVATAERPGLHQVSSRATSCFCGPTHGSDGFDALPRQVGPVELGPDLELGECPTLRPLWVAAIERPSGKRW